MKRKMAAILAADVAEYTRIIAEDEEEGLARLAAYREVFDDFVLRAGGRVFNTAGDSVMCEFPSAVEATRCAIDIQESLRTRNLACPPHRRMHFRIGICIGDVVDRNGDLLGDAVNVAARLQALAEPGTICVARNVQEAVANKISVAFRDLGEREMKNLPRPVHAFQIEAGAPVGSQAEPGSRAPPARMLRRFALPASAGWLAAGLAIAGGGGGLYWLGRSEQARSPIPVIAVLPSLPEPRPGAGPAVTPAEADDRLARAGGLVRDPATAAELYHNARVFEARGEPANARRDYMALAALGGEQIDPLLRLAALIRAQDGRAGAREVFAELARGTNRAAGLVHALQFEGAERMRRLSLLAAQQASYGPIHALLAIELGEDRQNAQTIADMRGELAALERFLAADRDGELIPYFLDQAVLAQWLERAQRRAQQLRAFFAEGRDRVLVQFSPSNAGWIGAIVPPEATTALEFRIGETGEFQATGLLQAMDPRTGRPMPSPSFSFASNTGRSVIGVRYLDANGVRSDVTTLVFDPSVALARALREALERTSQAWLAFGSGTGGPQLNFAHLASHRCAIERVEIGFNGAEPSRVVPLPPCDPGHPYAVPLGSLPRIELLPDVRSVSLRLTFLGGEVSELRHFPRPD